MLKLLIILLLQSAVATTALDFLQHASEVFREQCISADRKCDGFLNVVRMSEPESFNRALEFHTKAEGYVRYAKYLKGGTEDKELEQIDITDPVVLFSLGCCLFAGPCGNSFESSSNKEEHGTPEQQLASVVGSFFKLAVPKLKDTGESANLAVDATKCLGAVLGEDPCGDTVARYLYRGVEMGGDHPDSEFTQKARMDLAELHLRRYAGVTFTAPEERLCAAGPNAFPEGQASDAMMVEEYLEPLLKHARQDLRKAAKHLRNQLREVKKHWEAYDEDDEEYIATIKDISKVGVNFHQDADPTNVYVVLMLTALTLFLGLYMYARYTGFQIGDFIYGLFETYTSPPARSKKKKKGKRY